MPCRLFFRFSVTFIKLTCSIICSALLIVCEVIDEETHDNDDVKRNSIAVQVSLDINYVACRLHCVFSCSTRVRSDSTKCWSWHTLIFSASTFSICLLIISASYLITWWRYFDRSVNDEWLEIILITTWQLEPTFIADDVGRWFILNKTQSIAMKINNVPHISATKECLNSSIVEDITSPVTWRSR